MYDSSANNRLIGRKNPVEMPVIFDETASNPHSYPTLTPLRVLDQTVSFEELPQIMALGYEAFLRERAHANDVLVIWRSGGVAHVPAQSLLEELEATGTIVQ